ncbi:MAG: retroviral-like aspartic protease family protein [Methylomonas sp.]|uniref:retropepsin-like aspartic protease family protein n=1 Tax=Methylomonas sp. TaxID=418 RepID=UPI00260136AB|nr:retropepsin-like aspartic protease [Methylomonas sp.]MCK9606776.1 retroviral-like aspartic protease family protein [Methylomonas sp.]
MTHALDMSNAGDYPCEAELVMKRIILMIIGLMPLGSSLASDIDEPVAMRVSEAGTYYIPVQINGMEQMDFLVDTGSSHTIINEKTLAILKANGQAKYATQIKGVTADGSVKIVSLYTIQSIDIGRNCVLKNVDVAVFPGENRQILGISALSKVSSVVFSMSPPSLQLSNCSGNHKEESNALMKVSALR